MTTDGGDVSIEEVVPGFHDVLDNLLQLYQYDFGEIEGGTVSDDGRYHYLDSLEFDHGYLIRVAGELAGFALVNRGPSYRVPDQTIWWLEEFFVLRKYRRRRVGERAARLVFDRHPGAWELDQTPHNAAATAFWRAVCSSYPGYEEFTREDADWGTRPVQRFVCG